MKTILFLCIVSWTYISCKSVKPTTQMKTYDLQSKNLTRIPDSVLQEDTEVLLIGSGWRSIGPLGTEEDAPGKNSIKVIPPKICKLKKLRILNVSSNQIEELPNCFNELDNLETLVLSYNENFDVIKSLPLLLGLQKLKRVELVKTKLAPERFDYVRSQFGIRKVQVALVLSDLIEE